MSDTSRVDQMPFEALWSVAAEYAAEANADIFVLNGPINDNVMGRFLEVVEGTSPRRANAFICIATFGGDPHAGYMLSRSVQRCYPEGTITYAVVGDCYSAGTLIILGGSRVLVHPRGHLGPLDIQIRKSDEPFELASGLVVTNALRQLEELAVASMRTFFIEFKGGPQLSTRVALDLSVQFATGLFSELYKQIDPQRIGEDARAMEIMEHYGNLLNSRYKNLLPGQLDHLLEHYPDHGCIIDMDEARNLFRNVGEQTQSEERLLHLLRSFAMITVNSDREAVTLTLTAPGLLNANDHEPALTQPSERTVQGSTDRTPEGGGTPAPASTGNGKTTRGAERKRQTV